MFFQRFERLKTYPGINPVYAERLRDELLSLPTHLRKRITINYITRKLNITFEEASDLMYAAYRSDIFYPRFEVICPYCDKTYDVLDDLSLIPVTEVTCEQCEEDFVPDPRKVWVSYTLRPELNSTSNNNTNTTNTKNKSEPNMTSSLIDIWIDPEKFLEQLFRPNISLLKTLIDRLTTGGTNEEKKKALEELAENITSSIAGFYLIGPNVRTVDSEIDRLYRNLSLHPLLQKFGNPITVECKNYDSKVSAAQIRVANDNAKEYGATTCLYFSVEGVSGNTTRDGWYRVLEIYREDKRFIPVFKKEDYEAILDGENFLHILLRETEKIQMRRAPTANY